MRLVPKIRPSEPRIDRVTKIWRIVGGTDGPTSMADPTSMINDPSRRRQPGRASCPGRWLLPLLAVSALTAGSAYGQPAASPAEAEAEAVSPAAASGDAQPGAADRQAADKAVRGRVFDDALFGDGRPVEAATVFAYEVASLTMQRVVTDGQGHFLFGALPAGMYQIVAYKQGFSPSVKPLLRRSAELNQFVELRLQDDKGAADSQDEESFWAVRNRIPRDVLRELGYLLPGEQQELAGEALFEAEMVADSGVERLAGTLGDAQMMTAGVDFQGIVGGLELGFAGQFQQLAQQTPGEFQVPDGQASTLALEIADQRRDSKLRVATSSAETSNIFAGEIERVGREHYQVEWDGRTGGKSRTGVSAQYTEEINFNQPVLVYVPEIPNASRLFNFEGRYSSHLTDSTTLEAGVSYSQLAYDQLAGPVGPFSSLADDRSSLIQEQIGLYGVAGTQIQPQVFVEFGLFSTYRDGSLTLMPHGGMVVQLGSSDWKARAAASQRIEESGEPETFTPLNSAFFSDRLSCQQAGEACYEVTFSRSDERRRDDEISVGAVHREFAETLRLYFSPDFFDRLESLFVVEGDSLPELQFRMVRRLSPRVLAKLESNFAAGGGGIFYATNEALPYENEVRYLVTSLDTQFQQTSTGVFVAFHHLEQALNPIDAASEAVAAPEMEVQRLQLMLTQDLSILADVASNWAVRLNLELSRGATPYTLTDDDEISKKFTGGFSVSF